MLNRCGADKFLIVELCDTIRVDTVMLSNFEYFSSMFKEFKLFTKEFPPKTEDGWLDIGTFRAENVRENQFFKIERPAEFTKVIKLVFISHYGSEYYCPLTNLRVYGTTQMEEYIENE
ncbi:SUN domain-containing protein, partial [Zopfochytrium polystomum]